MDALGCTGLHPADVGPRLESSQSYEGAELGSPGVCKLVMRDEIAERSLTLPTTPTYPVFAQTIRCETVRETTA
jgi:hypothetical protein